MTTGASSTNNALNAGVDSPETGRESSLSNWAGDYVTDMLGKGQALGNEGYNAYTGPLTAGSSELQDAAFAGIGGLALPSDDMGVGGYTPQTFTNENAAQYMNPYITNALQPQIDAARRQGEIDRINNASRMTKAGSFGGSRQAVAEAGLSRGLGANLANITGTGYRDAYDKAVTQFNTEQDRGMTAQDKVNEYGLAGLGALADLGQVQRDIEGEGIAADRDQFEEERLFPYKQTQYMQSLLQSLPISAQSYDYQQPSYLNQMASDASDFEVFLKGIFGEGFSEEKTKEETAEEKVLRIAKESA